MKIINRIVAVTALAFAAFLPLTVHAQAATQACLDSNVKAHAEVLALFQVASVPKATFTAPMTASAFDNGVGWISSAIYEHTLAIRAWPNITAAQYTYMTTYIEDLRKLTTAMGQGYFQFFNVNGAAK